jgi:hypothetical protein
MFTAVFDLGATTLAFIFVVVPTLLVNGMHGGGSVSVFFTPIKYRVVKITRSCSKMVLRTNKHTKIYPGSDISLKVIDLRLVV